MVSYIGLSSSAFCNFVSSLCEYRVASNLSGKSHSVFGAMAAIPAYSLEGSVLSLRGEPVQVYFFPVQCDGTGGDDEPR